ncbi:hypothetical protein EJB05_05285, partial [Eragrostis curvula]
MTRGVEVRTTPSKSLFLRSTSVDRLVGLYKYALRVAYVTISVLHLSCFRHRSPHCASALLKPTDVHTVCHVS